MTPIEAMDKAVKIAGGQKPLGESCNRPQQTISDWCRSGKPDAACVMALSNRTGIDPHWFRPDVFPAPAKAGEAA